MLALGVPADGYRCGTGSRSGWAGSKIHRVSTSDSSTRSTMSRVESGIHHIPRCRSSSSAAMKSANPQVMGSSSTGVSGEAWSLVMLAHQTRRS